MLFFEEEKKFVFKEQWLILFKEHVVSLRNYQPSLTPNYQLFLQRKTIKKNTNNHGSSKNNRFFKKQLVLKTIH